MSIPRKRPKDERPRVQATNAALASYTGAAVAWMTMIFAISTISNIEQPGGLGGVPNIDKFEHMGLYFVLAAFISMALREHGLLKDPRWTGTQAPWTTALLAFTASTLYGLTDELHQFFVPGRTSDVGDLLMDAIGSILASLLFMYLFVRMRTDAA